MTPAEQRDKQYRELAATIASQAQAIADGTLTGPCYAHARLILRNAEQLAAETPDDRSGMPAAEAGPGTGTLTERRKADRALMAGSVAELARQYGLRAVVTGEQHGSRETSVNLSGSNGLELTVHFRGDSVQREPDTHVLSWHMRSRADESKGWRLNPAAFSGGINPYHGRKATDVVHGFQALCELLKQRFAAIADGRAFIIPDR
jgi:hypothetical protein